ncbi:MAG: transporter substrate-binding domain-containing protein [Reinekea sp.]|jgi:polar amino acid transport system substrate-binding protein
MKKFLVTFLLTATAIFSFSARADDSKVIVAAADAWPPFVDPAAPGNGLSLEIITAAFKTQGYEVQYKDIPWVRAVDGVKNGTYDILPDAWMAEARKADFLYSEPYATNEINFITRKDDPFEYTGLSSLKGKTVGVINGFAYDEEFMGSSEFERSGVPDFQKNIKKLLIKRIDITLEDRIVAKHILTQEDPAALSQIRFSEKSLSHEELYIAAGYKNPRHEEIISAFNKGLEIIKADGRLDKILNNQSLDN